MFACICSIKFELPEEDSGLPQLARQIVDGCKLLHPQRVDEVGALLAAAAAARRMAAPQPPPDAAQPAASLDARHRVSDLDRQLLREEQLRYLEAAGASATQALAAAAATASIDQLEAYLVRGLVCWCWFGHLGACSATLVTHILVGTVPATVHGAWKRALQVRRQAGRSAVATISDPPGCQTHTPALSCPGGSLRRGAGPQDGGRRRHRAALPRPSLPGGAAGAPHAAAGAGAPAARGRQAQRRAGPLPAHVLLCAVAPAAGPRAAGAGAAPGGAAGSGCPAC